MEYRIAICDDSRVDADYVAAFVKEWASADGVGVTLECGCSNKKIPAKILKMPDEKS